MTNKSKSQYVEVKARLEWVKAFKPDMGWNNSKADRGGEYTVDAIIPTEAYNELVEMGSQKTAKVFDEEENKWEKASPRDLRKADEVKVKFSRIHEAPFNYGGPPKVFHIDGKTEWDLDEDGLIGNGSEGYIKLSIYEYGDEGKHGTRWDGLQVTDHVPYEDPDYDPNDNGDIGFKDRSGGSTKPKATKAKAAPKVPEDLDDAIPFD